MTRIILIAIAAAAAVALATLPMHADAQTYTSCRAVDADTLDCAGQRIRIWGVDARDPPDPAATAAMRALIDGRPIRCEVPPSGQTQDRYGRLVRQCFVGRRDVGAELVRGGFARDLPRYSGGVYRRLQR